MRAPLFALALLAGVPSIAKGATEDVLIDQGVELRRQGQDAEALRVFEQALRQTGSAKARAQVALAHQALGQWRAAEIHLVQALEQGGSWIERNRQPLVAALQTIQGHLATVNVVGEPAGATVSVNGRQVGQLPLNRNIRVVGGQAQLVVSAPGHRQEVRTVSVAAGETRTERFSLARKSPNGGAPVLWFDIPDGPTLVGKLGYATLPEVSYMLPLASWFAVGGTFGIDASLFGSTGSRIPGTLTVYGAAPFQFRLFGRDGWRSRLTLRPGIGVTAVNFGAQFNENFGSRDRTGEYLAVLMHTSFAVGRDLTKVLSVGGGLDVPLTLFVGGGTDFVRVEDFSVIPIMLGPDLEVSPTDGFSLGLGLRMGPHLTSGDLTAFREDVRVDFGLRLQLGLRFGLD